jgi:hypothetical protein
LTLIIPGSDNPNKRLDMFMQPLIDGLHDLWNGVRTYDSSRKEYFNMWVAFFWSIHDFPAYGMFSRWSTHSCQCCPVCMGDTYAFVWNMVANSTFLIVTIGSCLMITRSRVKEISFARTQSLLRFFAQQRQLQVLCKFDIFQVVVHFSLL